MPAFVTTIAAFLVAILILVTVHEFGHFWVARRLGVKVLRFSIGFGRPLLTWRRRRDPTEYVIAAIPLGGYVKMLDEREEPVPAAEVEQAFNRQRLWKRSLIVLAGPAANFLFAILVYWVILVSGETGLPPEVGAVVPDSVAASAGFAPGDRIDTVGSRSTPTWSAVWFRLMAGALDGQDLPVQVQASDGQALTRVIPGDQLRGLDPGRAFLANVGLQGLSIPLPPVIGELVPGEPAERAGLQVGDRVSAVDAAPITDWRELVEAVKQRPGQPLRLDVERDGRVFGLDLTPVGRDLDGTSVGRIGAGVLWPEDDDQDVAITLRYGPIAALGEATWRVTDLSILTLRIIGRMLVGRASVENISSPIGIADTAGKTASFGLEAFVKFLAMLSVSLGLLNLLPIPILDGGHLLFFAIEGVLRRPVSEAVQARSQQIGLALLLSLMTLAFYVDIARLLG